MAIQWVNSFEDLSSAPSSGSPKIISGLIGWSNIGTSDDTITASTSSTSSSVNNDMGIPTLNGLSTTISSYSQGSGGFALFRTYSRSIVDNNKINVSAGLMIENSKLLKQSSILSIGGSNKISFGLNGKFAAIYINDTLASTSDVDVVTGRPWLYVTLFQNKDANRVYLKINNQDAADVQLPAGHSSNSVILDLGRATGRDTISVSDIVVYDSVDPMGPLLVHEFFKTGTGINQFTGSVNTVNNRPFSPTQYMSSETLGQEDRWTYSNILPSSVPLTSIKAVIQKAVAAAGGVSGGALNLRMRVNSSGATNYDTSVSSSLTSTTPVIVQKVWEVNPATSAPWTRSEVQGIQTGYVVAT